MKKILILLLSCVLIVLNVSACASKEKKLAGTWELESAYNSTNGVELNVESYLETKRHGLKDPDYLLYEKCEDILELELFSDGTCEIDSEYGTWKITDGKLFVIGRYDSISGKFKVNRNKLEFFDASIDGSTDNFNFVYKKTS